MEKIRITGRSSKLSLLQMQKVKRKIEAAFPYMQVELLPRESRGDQLQNIPLQIVEGSDFFTQDIFDDLANNEADIAVHSLKDMSGSHFFGENHFAIIERDDTRDVAIFNNQVEEKIKQGKTIMIGTCSPRREEMAIGFLRKALPQWNNDFTIETKIIRGNVDTRLRKLDAGEYDGIILATAGLNRLLEYEVACQPELVEDDEDKQPIKQLLSDKKLMLLPLIECVPAPCQGAIVAEANHSNKKAIEVLKAINSQPLMDDCIAEKKAALKYGTGCLQKFGVTTIHYTEGKQTLYAAGTNEQGEQFSNWTGGLPSVELCNKTFFSTTDYMGDFFAYQHDEKVIKINQPIVYVANYKAVKQRQFIDQLQQKNVWAAGTKTWHQLAKQNIWVTGSTDAFGLEFIEKAWQMPLLQIDKNNVCIITGNQAIKNWQSKGWNAVGTYSFTQKKDENIKQSIMNADAFFWTSIHQFNHYKAFIKTDALHLCPSGETANLLIEAGIEPVVFPNIKSFIQWKQ